MTALFLTLAILIPGLAGEEPLHKGQPASYWIEALKETDRKLRLNAIEALGALGPQSREAVEALIKQLENRDRSMSKAATGALGRVGSPAVPRLAKALSHERREVRWCAAVALGEMGPEAATAASELAKALDDEHRATRAQVSQALRRIGPAAVPHLLEALSAGSRLAQTKAADTLAGMGPSARVAIPELVRAFKTRDAPDLRRAAAAALGRIGPAARVAVPVLTTALYEYDAVRAAAARALGDVGSGPSGVIGALTEALRSENEKVSVAAATALGKLAPLSAASVPTLLAIIQPTEEEKTSNNVHAQGLRKQYLQKAVLAALEQLGPLAGDAAPSLVDLLRARNSRVNREVTEAIVAVGPACVGPLVGALREEQNRSYQRGILEALQQLGPDAKEATPKHNLRCRLSGRRLKVATITYEVEQ